MSNLAAQIFHQSTHRANAEPFGGVFRSVGLCQVRAGVWVKAAVGV